MINAKTFFIYELIVVIPLFILFIIGSVRETKSLLKQLKDKHNNAKRDT